MAQDQIAERIDQAGYERESYQKWWQVGILTPSSRQERLANLCDEAVHVAASRPDRDFTSALMALHIGNNDGIGCW